jgi:hypothetical protein
MAQVQFYKSAIFIGDTPIPCYPNCSFTVPKNFAIPPIIGNYWQLNYGDGLRMPTVELSLAVRNKASEVLSSTMMNYFLTRTADAAHDISPITGATYNGLAFWDGNSGWVLTGAKADSFTIGSSKGDDIRFNTRFCGSGITAIGSPPTYPGWDTSNLLRFNAVTFSGAMANKVWSFDLSFSNNCSPNLPLDGTQYPSEWNAGMMTAGLRLVLQGSDAAPADAAAFNIVITGAGSPTKTATFTINNPLNQNPDDKRVTVPRIMREYMLTLLGANAQATGPISVAISNF